MTMMNRVQSTQNYGAHQGVKIGVYGLAGMGKTTLCATCPNPIILSAESGLLSLAAFNLPYIQINNVQDLRDAYQWARSSTECRQNFQTVAIDSASEIAEQCLAEAKSKNKDGRMAYGDMIDQVTGVIKNFRDLPGFHIYMTFKQERIKDEITGVMMNQPMMPGNKLGQAVPYLPDELFKLDIEGTGANSYRYLRTQPDFMNTAKDRSGKLEPVEKPDIGYIINKITGVSA